MLTILGATHLPGSTWLEQRGAALLALPSPHHSLVFAPEQLWPFLLPALPHEHFIQTLRFKGVNSAVRLPGFKSQHFLVV